MPGRCHILRQRPSASASPAPHPPAAERAPPRARCPVPGRNRLAVLSAALAPLVSRCRFRRDARAGAPPRCGGPRRYPRAPGAGLRVAPTFAVPPYGGRGRPLAAPVLNPGGPVAPCRAAGAPGLALRAPCGALAAAVSAAAARLPRCFCGGRPWGFRSPVSRRPRLVVSGPPARRGLGLRGARGLPAWGLVRRCARFPAWLFLRAPPSAPFSASTRSVSEGT